MQILLTFLRPMFFFIFYLFIIHIFIFWVLYCDLSNFYGTQHVFINTSFSPYNFSDFLSFKKSLTTLNETIADNNQIIAERVQNSTHDSTYFDYIYKNKYKFGVIVVACFLIYLSGDFNAPQLPPTQEGNYLGTAYDFIYKIFAIN